MKKKQLKFLKALVETPSPTGSEEAVAQLVRERLSDVADEVQTDTMGSVHAVLFGKDTAGNQYIEIGESDDEFEDFDVDDDDYFEEDVIGEDQHSPTLMLSTHMDEIGLMITSISAEGFLSVAAVGGVDAAILPGMRVDVHTKKGTLRGVVGRKPIHLIEAEERKNVTPLDRLMIDLGLPAKQVKKKVRIGDVITFSVGFELFGKDMAVSRAFDDKCGVFISCRVIESLAEAGGCACTFVSAITTQEEIGTRGAMTSAHSIEPDVAIAFDVTHATDYPGIDKAKYGDISCGGGPVIARGPNINPLVFERLVAAAEAEGIHYQLEAEPSVTGTDARAIQVSRGGVPTGLISIPLRYMHTPTEVICLSDIEDAVRLITRFALDLESDASFVPGVAPDIEHPFADNLEKPEAPDTEKKIRKLNKRIDKLTARIEELREMPVAAPVAAAEEPPSSIASDERTSGSFTSAPLQQGSLPELKPLNPDQSPFGKQQPLRAAEFKALELDTKTIEYQSDAEVAEDTKACAPSGFSTIGGALKIMPVCLPDDESLRPEQ